MKLPWVTKPKLKERKKGLSSNKQYVITIYEQPSVVSFYAKNQDSSLYDLAYTIYTDCIINLKISTPLTCYVSFYHNRSVEYEFKIENCQSIEDIIKALSKQIVL